MERKERIIKNLKRLLAFLIFALPCAVYILLVRRRAGDALLFTAPYQWWVIIAAFAAGLFSYIILKKDIPKESDGAEDNDFPAPCEKAEESVSSIVFPDMETDEYPELFPEKEQKEEKTYDMSAEISAAISMQKAPTVTLSQETEADHAWEEFAKIPEKEKYEYPEELYENIPDLPDDYEVKTFEEEEAEFSLNYTLKRPSPGETVLSKIICVTAAALIAAGIAFAASFSYITENETGFSKGTKDYSYEIDVVNCTVSQKLLGSLSLEVTTSDGEKTELFPSTVFKGEKFSEKFDNIYAYMAYVMRQMKGAEKSVEDREDIITSFKDSDDGAVKYIEEIIGEKIK